MSRPTTLTGSWLTLAKKFESVGDLAAKLGVSTRTIRHWHDGDRTPHHVLKEHVDAIAREHKVTLIWKKKKGKKS